MKVGTRNSIQAYSALLAAIAVPLTVAFIGAGIQAAVAEASLKRDYVQLAVSVLTAPPSDENVDLKKWAAHLLSSNSPVPLGEDLTSKLSSGVVSLSPPTDMVLFNFGDDPLPDGPAKRRLCADTLRRRSPTSTPSEIEIDQCVQEFDKRFTTYRIPGIR